jgi:hypothetical protein
MKLAENQYLSFKKITNILTKFSIKERCNINVVVEIGPIVFTEMLSEMTSSWHFNEGAAIERSGDKIKFHSTCPCDIVRNYHLDNREVRFKVTRYVNEYMDVKYEDLA